MLALIGLAKEGKMTKKSRRRPKQRRSQQTVEAILDAVVRVLKREGNRAVTTNRIAEVAGVSIGSVYQYFPDKQAIFAALHRRHIEQIDRMVEGRLIEHAASPLDELMEAMIEGMLEAHSADPELYKMMATEVPHRAEGTKAFSVRLHGAFRLALAARAKELKKGRDLDEMAFVVANLVDALSHAALFRRPAKMPLAAAKAEVVRAVLAYLRW
jgi:AcrR family transcriptional regulator